MPVTIGVMGCVRTLPPEFPLEKAENAGNMVHGDAPFQILDGAVSSSDTGAWRSRGYTSFVDFVNNECSHLVLTLANTLRLDKETLPNLDRMSKFLNKVQVPLVIFGLGAQSQTSTVDDKVVPPEAVKLLRQISELTPMIGVRGEFTESILNRKIGVKNTFVAGCPSIFSRPQGISSLRRNLENMKGRPAFNGTKFHLPKEKKLLQEAIAGHHLLVEPVNKFNHEFYAASTRGEDGTVPYFLTSLIEGDESGKGSQKLSRYFRENYHLFRGMDDWIAFNRESVSFTYGSRFHVNMASLISGKPALWLTHDARTRELVDYLQLPSRTSDEFRTSELSSIDWQEEYQPFLDNFDKVRARFEEYLKIHGLPTSNITAENFKLDDMSKNNTLRRDVACG